MNAIYKGEEIEIVVRKHWIVYVGSFVGHAAVLLVAFFILTHKSPTLLNATAFVHSFMLFIWTSLFLSFTLQYFDRWYVTKISIYACDQKFVFNREEAVLSLRAIQDVSFEKQGLLAYIFDIGTLKVQNAAEDKEFIIDSVGQVSLVVETINTLKRAAQEKGV